MNLPRSRFQGGFCASGCMFFTFVLVLIAGAVLWGAISTYQGAYQMTSPQPRSFEPIPSPAEQNAARLKWRALAASLEKGEAVEYRFTADDLNAWFFADGKNADLVNHLRFRTIDDWIVAEVSVPLRFMADVPMLPSFKNRFFNGNIAARLSIEKNELKVSGLDIEGNDHRLPWLFTGQGYRNTAQQTIEQAIRSRLPEGDLILSRLDACRVENGEVILRFRGAGATASVAHPDKALGPRNSLA
jgi:hypothetical protein